MPDVTVKLSRGECLPLLLADGTDVLIAFPGYEQRQSPWVRLRVTIPPGVTVGQPTRISHLMRVGKWPGRNGGRDASRHEETGAVPTVEG